VALRHQASKLRCSNAGGRCFPDLYVRNWQPLRVPPSVSALSPGAIFPSLTPGLSHFNLPCVAIVAAALIANDFMSKWFCCPARIGDRAGCMMGDLPSMGFNKRRIERERAAAERAETGAAPARAGMSFPIHPRCFAMPCGIGKNGAQPPVMIVS
jgi:hypothetical protein